MDIGTYQRCYTCKGSKQVSPLGGIVKPCPACDSIGYTTISLPPLAIDDQPITRELSARELRVRELKASKPSKTQLKRVEVQTNQLIGG